MKKPSWTYVARKTAREFSQDQCTDLAAALTYYAVLAMFPAFIALISLIGLFGQGQTTVTTLLDVLRQILPRIGGHDARADPDVPGQAAAGGRDRLRRGSGHRTLVGVGLRRRVRPGHEPDVRGGRGTPGVEASPRPAAGHPGRAAADGVTLVPDRLMEAVKCKQTNNLNSDDE